LWSDVDLLLIADFRGGPLERLRGLDFPAGFEVIPLTLSELLKLIEKRNVLALEALNGICLRDGLGVEELLRKKLHSNSSSLSSSSKLSWSHSA